MRAQVYKLQQPAFSLPSAQFTTQRVSYTRVFPNMLTTSLKKARHASGQRFEKSAPWPEETKQGEKSLWDRHNIIFAILYIAINVMHPQDDAVHLLSTENTAHVNRSYYDSMGVAWQKCGEGRNEECGPLGGDQTKNLDLWGTKLQIWSCIHKILKIVI